MYFIALVNLYSEGIAFEMLNGISRVSLRGYAECCPLEKGTPNVIPILDIVKQQVDCNALEIFKSTNSTMTGSGSITNLVDPNTKLSYTRICIGVDEINSLVNTKNIPWPLRGSVINSLQGKCHCFETSSSLKQALDAIKSIKK
jgi:hypothetical protein